MLIRANRKSILIGFICKFSVQSFYRNTDFQKLQSNLYIRVLPEIIAISTVETDDALRLIKQIKGFRILEVYRGRPPIDIDDRLEIIVKALKLMATGLIREIDLPGPCFIAS